MPPALDPTSDRARVLPLPPSLDADAEAAVAHGLAALGVQLARQRPAADLRRAPELPADQGDDPE